MYGMGVCFVELVKRLRKGNSIDSGFTLIELLVVIIIIGILASIAVIGVSSARKTASDSQCLANATQVVKALTEYELATGTALVASPITFSGTLTSTSVTNLTSTVALQKGNILTKTTGTGTFGGGVISSIESSGTQINTTGTNSAGTISFTASGSAGPAGQYSWDQIQNLWNDVTYIARPIENFNTATLNLPYYLKAIKLGNGSYRISGHTAVSLSEASFISTCLAVSG